MVDDQESFDAYGHLEECNHHVFVKAHFTSDADSLYAGNTRVLLISPKPTEKIRQEICKILEEQGPWISDFLWSDERANE